MTALFLDRSPVVQALLAGTFTWAVTAVGALAVVLARDPGRRILDVLLGFAAGVMIAASFFSLLLPAVEQARAAGGSAWFPVTVGFLLGGGFLAVLDRVLPHLHPSLPVERAEGPRTAWQRSTLLVAAITLHNIPEGLALGVAFGGAALQGGGAGTTLAAAVALTVGIGLQNLPEGMAVALPLRGEGMGRGRAFLYGQASALVEPIAAVGGAAAVLTFRPVLPYALAFAAGAMIYVVVEELIPESHAHGHPDAATAGALSGFAVMMCMDLALG
ncbi:MAG: ZIP family metal transporter [Gemmatimonadota bacterium]